MAGWVPESALTRPAQRSAQMVKWLDASKESNVHAVLVVRHGTLVFEH